MSKRDQPKSQREREQRPVPSGRAARAAAQALQLCDSECEIGRVDYKPDFLDAPGPQPTEGASAEQELLNSPANIVGTAKQYGLR